MKNIILYVILTFSFQSAFSSIGFLDNKSPVLSPLSTLSTPPHIDLEATSEDLSTLLMVSELLSPLNQYTALDSDQEGFLVKPSLEEIIRLGKVNLAWLKKINTNREDKIRLSLPGELKGIPVEEPLRYSEATVLKSFDDFLVEAPGEFLENLYADESDLSDSLIMNVEEYRALAKEMDKIYSRALRWKLLSPYLDYYKLRKYQDVRGYYHLSKIPNLRSYLKNLSKEDLETQNKVKTWVLMLCLNNQNLDESCKKRVDSTHPNYNNLVDEFWNKAETNYNSFFNIPTNIKNKETYALKSENKITTAFKRSSVLERDNLLKENIEEEWNKQDLKVELSFDGDYPERAYVIWEDGATPHVKGLGNGVMVMDANSSLNDWTVQWTVRHEYGHILGVPDCYLEFYDDVNKEMISYQIDTNDLMCSRKGVLNKRIVDEIKRVYF